MTFFVENENYSLWFSLNVIRLGGLLVPRSFNGNQKTFCRFCAGLWIMFTSGTFVIGQIGDLIKIWGNLTLMTETLLLLLTIFAYLAKMFNLMMNDTLIQSVIDECDEQLKAEDRQEGKDIIQKCNKATTKTFYLYGLFGAATVAGWVVSAPKNQLPLRAWYPYDTSKSPAYELTYVHQSLTTALIALFNDSWDFLVTSMTAVCRSRLQLLGVSLRTLCHDINITDKLLTPEEEKTVSDRLRHCVLQHQIILEASAKIKTCFAFPILAQLTFSMVVMCVTAYQLTFENGSNFVRLLSMTAYLMGNTVQVFLYCYQGELLTEESSKIADAAYECPWYVYSIPLRRTLLVMMARSRRYATLTAGGYTTVSLECFMAIIKASYSFFTVLQQVGHE